MVFSMDDGGVRIKPIKSRLTASFKAVPPLKQPMTLKEMAEAATTEQAREAAR